MDAEPSVWDVIVVGAGPAGSSAARVAAEGGASVLLLDRASFPRYKTCGGGIIGISREWMPESVRGLVEERILTTRFTLRGGRASTFDRDAPVLGMVDRETFDQALVDAAIAAGAEFRDGVTVRELDEVADGIELRAGDETFRARVVIGADGSSSRIAAHVGVRYAGTDLGLEDELMIVEPNDFDGTVLLDWGPQPGSYAWMFPKDGIATVGVISRRGTPDLTRAYLADWIASLGLTDAVALHSSGHLTRWREPGSPVRRGRILVVGDAAGLLEPWTREGISFALRSGSCAGEAAARAVASDGANDVETDARLDEYAARVERELAPDQRAGALILALFERHPGFVHRVLRSRIGQQLFVRVCRGETTLGRILRRPVLRAAARLLGGGGANAGATRSAGSPG